MSTRTSLQNAWRRNGLIWIALLLLLALTTGTAFLRLGAANSAINLAIAALKTLLVVLFFMHWRQSRPLTRLVAPVALLMIMVLFGLASTDFETRDVGGPPWVPQILNAPLQQAPPQQPLRAAPQQE